MSDYYDDSQKKVTSVFKDSLGQIRRLDVAYIRATRFRESGSLEQWRWVLDTIALELAGDIERLKEKEKKDFNPELEKLNDDIDNAFKKKIKSEEYQLLQRKEKLLRIIQETCGKGTFLRDVEEEFI